MDPKERPTARNLLEHPFIVNAKVSLMIQLLTYYFNWGIIVVRSTPGSIFFHRTLQIVIVLFDRLRSATKKYWISSEKSKSVRCNLQRPILPPTPRPRIKWPRIARTAIIRATGITTIRWTSWSTATSWNRVMTVKITARSIRLWRSLNRLMKCTKESQKQKLWRRARAALVLRIVRADAIIVLRYVVAAHPDPDPMKTFPIILALATLID